MSAAYANPVVFDPIGSMAYLLVLGSATVIEAGIVTLLLLFWGTDPKPVYMSFTVGNLVIYFLIFLPLLDVSNLWLAEAAVVIMDGVLIKAITFSDAVRDDTFRPLRWLFAFCISVLGNIVSYYVGSVTSG